MRETVRVRRLLLGWHAVLLLAWGAAASPAAMVGGSFAEVYHAFGPMHTLHSAYGDYLFEGTAVAVPQGLFEACDSLLLQLGELHLEFLTQTPAEIAAPNAWIHLRVRADAFCLEWGESLQEVSQVETLEGAALQSASASGLFPAIFELSEWLDLAFTESFDGLPGDEDRWRFSVGFSARTIMLAEILRIDDDLPRIFYGGSERTAPPFPVDDEVEEAMRELIQMVGLSLTVEEREEARDMAGLIYGALVRQD